MNNNFIDICQILGSYNDKDVFLYTSSKYNQIVFFILQIVIYCKNGQILRN